MPCKVEVGCLKNPEAFTIGSQLLDGTLPWLAPMAGKAWQPNHKPHAEGRKTGTCYTDKERKGQGRAKKVPHAQGKD